VHWLNSLKKPLSIKRAQRSTATMCTAAAAGDRTDHAIPELPVSIEPGLYLQHNKRPVSCMAVAIYIDPPFTSCRTAHGLGCDDLRLSERGPWISDVRCQRAIIVTGKCQTQISKSPCRSYIQTICVRSSDLTPSAAPQPCGVSRRALWTVRHEA
jgi:hypothetical protein